MKPIVLITEDDCNLYYAPDYIADTLKWHCNNFIKWLECNNDELCYCDEDFVKYMNNIVLSNEKIVFAKNIGCISLQGDFPDEVSVCPSFSF